MPFTVVEKPATSWSLSEALAALGLAVACTGVLLALAALLCAAACAAGALADVADGLAETAGSAAVVAKLPEGSNVMAAEFTIDGGWATGVMLAICMGLYLTF